MRARHPSTRLPGEVLTDLMIRYARGDRRAFGPLFAIVWPLVVHRCRHVDDPEDVAQEVLLKVFSRVAEFDCERDGLAWVFAIARYEVLTVLKRTKRRREDRLHDFSATPSHDVNAEDATLRKQMHDVLARAVNELSTADRALIAELMTGDEQCERARDAAGTSAAVASAQLRSAAFRKRKQRAIQRLQLAWKRLL